MQKINEEIKLKIEQLFDNKEFITKEEIRQVYNQFSINLSDNSLRKNIFKFKEEGILNKVGNAIYSLESKQKYIADIDTFLTKIRRLFTANYIDIKYCAWSTTWLHDFMVHQPFNSFYIFEVEKDMLETSFHLFNDNNFNAFYSTDISLLQNYEKKKNLLLLKILLRVHQY